MSCLIYVTVQERYISVICCNNSPHTGATKERSILLQIRRQSMTEVGFELVTSQLQYPTKDHPHNQGPTFHGRTLFPVKPYYTNFLHTDITDEQDFRFFFLFINIFLLGKGSDITTVLPALFDRQTCNCLGLNNENRRAMYLYALKVRCIVRKALVLRQPLSMLYPLATR